MENTYFEFQSKGSHAPVFKLKHPDYNSNDPMGPDKKILLLKDGERFIGKIIGEDPNTLTNEIYITVEDINGNVTTISSKNYHKITDPKNFSKNFKLFKIQNHIIDK